MRFVSLSEDEARARLETSISGVRRRSPDFSADPLITRTQRRVLVAALLVGIVSIVVAPLPTVVGLIAIITFLYVSVTLNRAYLFVRSARSANTVSISDEEAQAVADEDLPIYTVLVPAFHEPEVIGQLLANLARLDYPRDRLDVKLLLEADDLDTIEAVRSLEAPRHVEVVLVPPGGPRTKPKALNYGLTMARGDIVTIYDAEDQPEPLQLRRAAIALGRAGHQVACIQAKLSFGNAGQNLLTRWFTIEYSMWFSLFLPGLVEMEAPLPLGGTSNHFRRDVLEEIGAWDPHNVTEDADLGIRLARLGFRCSVLDSVTLEEANSDFINWIKQRSRWYKGYLQTLLIHLRHPVQVYRELGWRGLTGLILFVGGTPLLAFLNPLFWLLTAVWYAGGHVHLIQQVFPGPVFYPATACWIFGNFLAAYLTILSCRLSGRTDLLWAALLVPLYWVMMSIAAIKAVWQLIATPTFWEKTMHGLDRLPRESIPRPSAEGIAAT